MSDLSIKHSSIEMERHYPVPPARVFAAWEDPEARQIWGSPGEGITLRQEAADFSVGGVDVNLCLAGGEPVARVSTRYLNIVADARILICEEIEAEGMCLGASLVSVEMMADAGGTRLFATIQTAGLDGSGLESEVEGGWSSALDGLGRLLASESSAP